MSTKPAPLKVSADEPAFANAIRLKIADTTRRRDLHPIGSVERRRLTNALGRLNRINKQYEDWIEQA